MSHRKYNQPRRGSLAFAPRKRARSIRARIGAFPKDNTAVAPHLTAFVGYKAGCTHVLREVNRPGSKNHKREIVEQVTVLETPPLVVIGVVGYTQTPRGMRALTTVWAQHLSEEARRRFYKNWYRSKQKAFSRYTARFAANPTSITRELERIKKHCQVVRVIAQTQIRKVDIGQKKAHIVEIQVNGGADIKAKVDFAYSMFEKTIPVKAVFNEGEMIDVIGVTKGHGFEGTIHRFGARRLQRKTHRGNRKIACIGAWHPERIRWTVARAGQRGFHMRTEINKKVYRVGQASLDAEKKFFPNAQTDADLTSKDINPMGGFPHYGLVTEDFMLIKGGVLGTRKRVITLRKSLLPQVSRAAVEEPSIKFIDTSSKFGHGRFQTLQEKSDFMGPLKHQQAKEEK